MARWSVLPDHRVAAAGSDTSARIGDPAASSTVTSYAPAGRSACTTRQKQLDRSARAVGLTEPADGDDERRLGFAEPPDVVGDVGAEARPPRGEVVARHCGGYVVTEQVQLLAEPLDLLA